MPAPRDLAGGDAEQPPDVVVQVALAREADPRRRLGDPAAGPEQPLGPLDPAPDDVLVRMK